MDAKSGANRAKALYIVVVVLYWAALYFYVPTLSTYAESKTTNLALVGTVVAQYGLWQAVARFPLGIIADRVGKRKPFIIGGFVLAALGALIMGLSNDINGLIIGRALTGFAASVWVLLVVAFSGLFPPEEAVKASALLSAVNALSRTVATGSNGPLINLGGYSLAFFVASVAAVLAALVLLPAKEVKRKSNPQSFADIVALITRRDVLVPALLGAVFQYAIWSSTFGFTNNLAQRLGATDVMLSTLTSMNILLVFGGNLLTTQAVKWIGERGLVIVSFVFIAAGLTLLFFAPTLPWVFAGQVLMGLASGVGYPVLMGLSIRNVDDSQRATAMGLFQAVYAIGMFGGPALSGVIADGIGLQPMFLITGLVCGILGFVGASQLRLNKAQTAE